MLTPEEIIRVVMTDVFAAERVRVSRMAAIAAEARQMVDVLEAQFTSCLGAAPDTPADIIADGERELATLREKAAEFAQAHAAAARRLALAEANRRKLQLTFAAGFHERGARSSDLQPDTVGRPWIV